MPKSRMSASFGRRRSSNTASNTTIIIAAKPMVRVVPVPAEPNTLSSITSVTVILIDAVVDSASSS